MRRKKLHLNQSGKQLEQLVLEKESRRGETSHEAEIKEKEAKLNEEKSRLEEEAAERERWQGRGNAGTVKGVACSGAGPAAQAGIGKRKTSKRRRGGEASIEREKAALEKTRTEMEQAKREWEKAQAEEEESEEKAAREKLEIEKAEQPRHLRSRSGS